jgi:RIO-like serine/threonine protein kinase
MRGWSAAMRERNLVSLAHALVESAEHGLVHGRHSSENILVADPHRFHIIDFSHSQVFDRFHPQGFMRDVGRIAARLISEDACTQETAMRLFDEVSRAAPTGSVSADRMAAECEKVLTNSKRRQRLERNWYTFWRGLPSRLRG